ncbi:bolA-like protein 3 [Dinothrombium tinctorium]|uniref:BolA-like protein 3 n=1 Tax=Dinothrombium tinctorium TaxID=1965070 RepID=A0A3S3QXD2_9ACAR|nr:bolA-like protein 3 [Dinothrombium tinctorium]RWS15491.1 bolA-like protein 3 [Dinothrombium tinctorium]RWS15509.1 bolA-like protein 3 [Dinothrombium tinctorium]
MSYFLQRFIHGIRCFVRQRFTLQNTRFYALKKTDGEKRLINALRVKFPEAVTIEVNDISGGCGDMFEIHIVSSVFKDKSYVQQHQLVNEALKEEIKSMHGLRIYTSLPSKS